MPTSINSKTKGRKASSSRSKSQPNESSPLEASQEDESSQDNPQEHLAQQRPVPETLPPQPRSQQDVVLSFGKEPPLPITSKQHEEQQPQLVNSSIVSSLQPSPEVAGKEDSKKVGHPSNSDMNTTLPNVNRKRARVLDSTTKTEPKSRKKSERRDERWSMRFNWSDDLHRDFVKAVFSIGIQQAEAAELFGKMPKQDSVSEKTVTSYLQHFKERDGTKTSDLLHKAGNHRDAGGESKVHSKTRAPAAAAGSDSAIRNCSVDRIKEMADDTGTVITKILGQEALGHGAAMIPQEFLLPTLTEAEQASPVGETMGSLMVFFLALKRLLRENRIESNNGHSPSSSSPLISPDSTQDHTVVPNHQEAAQKETNEQEKKQGKCDDSRRKTIKLLDIMQKDMLRSSAVQETMRAMKKRQDAQTARLGTPSKGDAQLKEGEGNAELKHAEAAISASHGKAEGAETEPTANGVNSDNQDGNSSKKSDDDLAFGEIENDNDVSPFDFLLQDI